MMRMKLKYINLKKKKSTLLKFNVNIPQISISDDWFIIGLSQHFLSKGLRSRNITIIKKCLLDLKYELFNTHFIKRLYPPCGIEHKYARHNVFWHRLRCAVRSFLFFNIRAKTVSQYSQVSLSQKQFSKKFKNKRVINLNYVNILNFFFLKFLCNLQVNLQLYFYDKKLFDLFDIILLFFKKKFFLKKILSYYKNIFFFVFTKKNLNNLYIFIYFFYSVFLTNYFSLKLKNVNKFLKFHTILFKKQKSKFFLTKTYYSFYLDHFCLIYFYNVFFFVPTLYPIKFSQRKRFSLNSYVKYKYTGFNIDYSQENIIVDKKIDYLSYILFSSVYNDLSTIFLSPNRLLKKKKVKEKELIFSFDNIIQLFSYIKSRNRNLIHKKKKKLGSYISLSTPKFWLQLLQQNNNDLFYLNSDFIQFVKKVYLLKQFKQPFIFNKNNKQALLQSNNFKKYWYTCITKKRQKKKLFYSGYLYKTYSISYLLSQHLTYYMPLYVMSKHTFPSKKKIRRTMLPEFQSVQKRRKLVIFWFLHLIKKNKNKTFEEKLKDELKKILIHQTYLSVLNDTTRQKVRYFRQFTDYRW